MLGLCPDGLLRGKSSLSLVSSAFPPKYKPIFTVVLSGPFVFSDPTCPPKEPPLAQGCPFPFWIQKNRSISQYLAILSPRTYTVADIKQFLSAYQILLEGIESNGKELNSVKINSTPSLVQTGLL